MEFFVTTVITVTIVTTVTTVTNVTTVTTVSFVTAVAQVDRQVGLSYHLILLRPFFHKALRPTDVWTDQPTTRLLELLGAAKKYISYQCSSERSQNKLDHLLYKCTLFARNTPLQLLNWINQICQLFLISFIMLVFPITTQKTLK